MKALTGLLAREQAPWRASASPLAWDGGVITSFGDGMNALYKKE